MAAIGTDQSRSTKLHSSISDGLVMYAGSLESDDSTAAGELPPTVKSVKWAYSTRPIYGWGDTGTDQKSTAGWLAAMPVFEPHWQVCCLPVTISG